MKHELKTDPFVFEAVLEGVKNYELRFNDRGFGLGDVLVLKETVYSYSEMKRGLPLEYTGREVIKRIGHILTGYGLKDGWCILSFKPEVTTLDSAPTQCLAEVKAQAGRDGFVAGALSMDAYGMANIVEHEADEYANKIRQQAKPSGAWLKDSNTHCNAKAGE